MTVDNTDAELLRLLAREMMHTTELAAALGLTVDETCSRMGRLQRLGVIEYTPVPQNPRDQN
jgi:DNA-binding Lrp family transcriptional regulator